MSFLSAYGMADIENNTPVSPNTVFNVASISKQFTATAVLLLTRQRKLSLSDEIHDFISELPDYGTPISIQQVLTHTAGLREYERHYLREDDYNRADRTQQLEIVLRDSDLESVPGTRFSYTNTDYLLAGIAVERVSGQSLRDFADEQIFQPLGMVSTAYVSDLEETAPGKSLNYHLDENGNFVPVKFGAHAGPTGLQTTATDLQYWSRNFVDGEVGGRELVEELQIPGTLSDGTRLDYALGLEVRKLDSFDAVFHDGATIGTRAAFARFPSYSTGIAVLCNRDDVDPVRKVAEIAAVVLESTIP